MKILFLLFFFNHHFSIVLAQKDLSDSVDNAFNENDLRVDELPEPQKRFANKDYVRQIPTCEQMAQTTTTPFIVLLLLKSSGRFLGMGSIIDKKSVLTANTVTQNCLHHPSHLLVLAGRLNPWWGKDSQVQPAIEISMTISQLALVTIKRPFRWTAHIMPIKIPYEASDVFPGDFGRDWGVFGFPRSNLDTPGDHVPKENTYLMNIETEVTREDDMKLCLEAYPDLEFNETSMVCSYANGTESWGVIGSPTVAVNSDDKVYQIALVIKASSYENIGYHIHLKLHYVSVWIRAHTSLGLRSENF